MGNMVEENACIRAFFSSTVLLSVREVFERYNFCNVSEMSALASFWIGRGRNSGRGIGIYSDAHNVC